MARLEKGDTFPTLTVDTVNDGTIRIPQDLGDSWGVILVYRGHW